MSSISGGGGRVERRTGDTPGSAPFGVEAAMRRIESGELQEADARLVVQRLRECRSKTARWCEQAAKTALTDAERIAVEAAERCLRWQAAVEAEGEARDGRPPQKSVERARFADTLLAMRERLAKGGET